jgi:hypothetical protein
MRWRLRSSLPEGVAAQTWNAGFNYGVGGTRLAVNLLGIHPFKIIATVANAGAENWHTFPVAP